MDGKFVEVARESECSNLNLQWLPIFGHENMKMGTGICLFSTGTSLSNGTVFTEKKPETQGSIICSHLHLQARTQNL